ncbi:MAG: sugar ABC transporter permease [Betaproteobacteria bacterium RIFCSPLOWO2_12_FULL_62_58]|nr:MAG: sugar ABC transporter permease [Betaproteobacteria bacterium RIFCSPLOWO2_12_FULL_62_58]
MRDLGAFLFPRRHALLIWQFAQRDVLARYRGSTLGLTWAFAQPLLMLGVYTFVFHEVFKVRWHGGQGGGVEFALQVYAGLVVYNIVAECAGRAPRLVLDYPNLVKKVIFPLEILPWTTLLASAFHAAINCLVLLAAAALLRGSLTASALALPLVLLPLVPALLGISWFLAALGVFVRDVGQVVALALNLLLFLSPVFYPLSALPERWQGWLLLNPLAAVIEQVRRVVIEGAWPDWKLLALQFAAGVIVAALGARWFAATRKGFADVL